ncbi:MAG: DUF1778 domain-containing protein [Gammaproteobacteria bacterium]|nr:MAG: DUF1778 domain-containing protein [Gammaproteobacteria bacterium]
MSFVTNEQILKPLSNQIREVLQQAANLVGITLNQFIIQASLEKAQTIIEHEQIVHLCKKDAEVFFKALDNPPPPNDKLVEAVTFYKESSLYAPNRNT